MAASRSENTFSAGIGSNVSGITPGTIDTFVSFVDCVESAEDTFATGPLFPALSSPDLARSVSPKVPSVQFSTLTL